jgi:hypothetical protein
MSLDKNQLWILRGLLIIATVGFVIMFASIVNAVIHGNLAEEGRLLIDMPWGFVSLVDIYLGLLLFCIWIIWRERFRPSAVLWALLVMTLGNLLSCLYLIKVCCESRGNINRFWLGARYSEDESGE